MLRNKRTMTLPPGVERTDDAVWAAWRLRNSLEENDKKRAYSLTLKFAFAVGLLVVALFWTRAADNAVVIRFVVTLVALVAAMQSLNHRRYVPVVVFAAIAAIYNPVYPAFDFVGSAALAVVVVTAGVVGASMMLSPKASA